MRVVGSFQREIKQFLLNHGATNVDFIRKGKHPKVVFLFNGTARQSTISLTPSTQGTTDATIQTLRKMLGPAIEPEAREKRSLEAMTPSAPINGHGLAHRTLDELRAIANGPAAAETVTAAPEPIARTRYATNAIVHHDGTNKEYDIVFQARQKSIMPDGSISVIERPVSGITLPSSALLALADKIQPLAKLIRHIEAQRQQPVLPPVAPTEAAAPAQPEPAPEPKKPLISWKDQTPKGAENLIRLVDLMVETRRRATEMSNGANRGIVYNKNVAALYEQNELGEMPFQVKAYLGELIPHIDAIREWVKTEPASTLASISPRALLKRVDATPRRQQRPKTGRTEDDHATPEPMAALADVDS